jgi:hypothetical protein
VDGKSSNAAVTKMINRLGFFVSAFAAGLHLPYRNLVHVRSWDSLEIVHKIPENQGIKSRRRKRFQDANLHLFAM